LLLLGEPNTKQLEVLPRQVVSEKTNQVHAILQDGQEMTENPMMHVSSEPEPLIAGAHAQSGSGGIPTVSEAAPKSHAL
jgi:hypothetical protein